MAIDTSQFIPTFLEESFEGLDLMESSLLNLQAGDIDSINAIFRAAHSIKGGAGTFGFSNVSDFTHGVETLLDEMRNGKRDFDQAISSILLNSVDCLRDMLSCARDGTLVDEVACEDNAKKIECLLAVKHSEVNTDSDQETKVVTNIAGWEIGFFPESHLLRTGNDPARMFNVLSEYGPVSTKLDISQLPVFQELDPEECYLNWMVRLEGNIAKQLVLEIFEWVEDDCKIELKEVTQTVEAPVTHDSNTAEPSAQALMPRDQRGGGDRRQGNDRRGIERRGGQESTSIRVSIEKIDQLINNVGELVITQSMLSQQSENMAAFTKENLDQLHDGLDQLERHTREIQDKVMKIRMLPISFVFNRFPRLVHDLCSKLDKNADLVLSGEQTELDKTVMEKIGDPLVHLVRNALDHGIESSELRVKNGKPETGLVHLNAYHRSGSIIIEVIDDGNGIDPDKLRAKALSAGMIKNEEEVSDEEAINLIFHAGFSTAEELSDVSGRGVGMDVVRRNVNDLGGVVSVASTMGVGTTFTVRLPLTLAILDGQLIKVSNQIYIVPVTSIVESIQIHKEHLNVVSGKDDMYRLREEYISMLKLSAVFGLEDKDSNIFDQLLVVVEGDGSKVGLIVDGLLGQQQFVIKSLETNYQRIEGVSGATILGNGTVALIIDVPGIVSLSKRNHGEFIAKKCAA